MRVRRFIFALLTATGAVAVLLTCALAFPGGRSAAVRAAAAVYLSSKGFQLQHLDVSIGHGVLDATGIAIADHGRPFFSSDRIHVTYGAADRALGISSIELEHPHLVVRRAADGSYDFSRLLGNVSGNGARGQPIRAALRVSGGSVDVLNPFSPAIPGREFALNAIDADATIDQGAVSTATASMILESAHRESRLSARYSENDLSRVARATVSVRDVALAPVVDSIVSSNAFVVEGGSADLTLHAYAVAWANDAAPQWHVIGNGFVRNGRLRTLPFAVPVRDVNGPVSVFDGTLWFPRLTADAAGVPMAAAGTVELLPEQRLGLRLDAEGPLERVRAWLPFSAKLPLAGPIAIAATVDGAPSGPRVDLDLRARRELRYGGVPVHAFRTNAYYYDGHVALRDTFAAYARATVYGYGDIDLTASPVAGQFVASLRAPSSGVPWIADVDSTGITRAGAALSGPLMKMGGSGFAMTSGGEERIRAEVSANADRVAIASIVQDARGGELIASAAQDRTGTRALTGDFYAREFSARTNGRMVALPGITRNPVGLPEASGIVSGYAAVRGTQDVQRAAIRLSARRVAIAGRNVGRVEISGTGSGDGFRIARLAISGPDARVEAAGVARLLHTANGHPAFAGAIQGNARLNLAALRVPGDLLGGTADGSFAVALDGRSWMASTTLADSDTSISGVPVRDVRAVIGQVGRTITVYAASADAAGGQIVAQGSLPGSSPGSLDVAVSGVDLALLHGGGIALRHGVVVGMAHISGTANTPSVSGAAVLNGGSYGGSALGGDAQADYRHGILTVRGGRVVADGSVASFDGTVGDLNSSDPSIALDIAMPVGDLTALSSAFASSSVALSGIASGQFRASGSIARPTIAGNIASDAGTVRGVAFNDLRASFAAAPGAVDLRSGSVRFGSSQVAMSGSVAPDAARLRATSSYVNLDDFNNFFNGKDVLEGHGSLDIAVTSSRSLSNASGFVHLADSRISGIPLGTLDGRFRPMGLGVAVDVDQRGALAQSNVSVSLVRDRLGRPNAFADGTIRSLDLAALAPYVRAEDQGISGIASATVHASGRPGGYRGDVAFNVNRGRVRSTDLHEASGNVSVDSRSIHVRALRVAIDGASLDGRGTFYRSGRVDAHVLANVSDLHALARFSKHPVSMNGAVVANIDARGTLANPNLHAHVAAAMGQVQNVAYDSVNADAIYDRGKIVASGNVALADGHGNLRMAATLPAQTKPFGIGPNDRAVRLYGTAAGVGIASLNPLLGNNAAGDGILDGRFAVLGTVGKPVVSGDLHMRGVTVRSRFDKVPLTNLTADVALAHDTIDLQRLHAAVGSGTLDAHGSVHIVPATALRPAPSLQYVLGAALHDAEVDIPDYLTGTVNAHLGLTKSAAVPYLFGDVEFSHTSIPFASLLALATGKNAGPVPGSAIPGLPPLRKNHIIVYGGSIFGGGDQDHVLRPTPAPTSHPTALAILPKAVGLGLKVTAGNDVAVSGILNVTGTGTIDVSGDTTAPRLAGTLTAVRGRAGFFNTSFDLLDGWLTFHPKEGLIPTVTADAITRTEDADITVSIYGRVDQLHTDMVSDPPMNREAIVATMLRIPQINSALASSQGQPQSAFGVSPGNLVSGAVAGQILGALNIGLEQVFNLEEVTFGIDPLGRPTLELRKQISPRAYSLYRTTFTVPPAQALGLAYQVRRALRVEFTQSQSTPGLLTSYAYPQTSFTVRMTFH